MSHLDQHLVAHASRGLSFARVFASEVSPLEPGWVHPVSATDERVTFAIALHLLSEVVGKHIALKVTQPSEAPGEMRIYAPAGQLIEADDGELKLDSVSEIGTQELGAYREWVCDPDGHWLMVRRIGGGSGPAEIPYRIVIKGTPVTILGVPLVNTPQPTARVIGPAPLPVIVAEPVQIVPRAPLPAPVVQRPAPLAPVPVPTIELEDAFADRSLEMNETGDLFRVAAAVRYPVTLRTTTVAGTDFEEIGVL